VAVFDLVPGHVTRLGRHPISDIVIEDDACSREHCEVFYGGQGWVLRDLQSRNGTYVGNRRVEGDWPLEHEQVIRVGETRLEFSLEGSALVPRVKGDTVFAMDTHKGQIEGLTKDSKSKILLRAKQSRYHVEGLTDDQLADLSRGLRHLYEMAIRSASAQSPRELAEIVLECLFAATTADIGAVLVPREKGLPADQSGWTCLASRTRGERPYTQVSDSVSRAVLRDGVAVLAEDVETDLPPRTPQSRSLHELEAQSVICAPIRRQESTSGLIHLYTTSVDRQLTPENLHFTLAAADHLGMTLRALDERVSLKENLARAEQNNRTLREQLHHESQLIGESPVVQSLRDQTVLIGPTDATVLIRGESGVGKELVARAIHQHSRRKDKPLVCMNCAALTETLLESELFGHEKGAFTGATERKIGKFEQAHEGTLFLDEVGEMSLSIQSKFLRVLEGHPFERVGGQRPITTNVRVVAATNRDLEEAVKSGEFRQDLYFRLHVVEITIPPLRERTGDMTVLAKHFVERFARKTSRVLRGFTPAALQLLESYHWPGNVRELQNAIERAVILCRGPVIEVSDLQLSSLNAREHRERITADFHAGTYREMTIDEVEQAHILATLEYTDWNKTRAAEILAIERSTLDRRLKRYGVSRPDE
jgi:Nif-specific regulatory protein